MLQMDKVSQNFLTIQRVKDGGYLVWPYGTPQACAEPIFACTTIGEALDFMRDLMTINRLPKQNCYEPPSHASAIPNTGPTGWMEPEDVA